MEMSIFRPSKDLKEKSERHRIIHFVWKTKIFIPLVWYLERKIKKFMIKDLKDIPDRTHNRNFRILYYSFERGVQDWYYSFYQGIQNGKKNKPKYKELKDNYKNKATFHWYKIPKFFLNLLVTICLEDTAYRELMNCVLMRFQGEMNKVWKPEIKHRFPMYISVHDGLIPFFFEWMRVGGGGMLKVDKDPKEVNLQTNEEKSIKLNKEAVMMIEKLNDGDQQRFKLQLNKFLLKLLGQERMRLCPGCGQTKVLKDFGRPGTTNIEFLACKQCAFLKPEDLPKGTAGVKK